VKKGDYVVCKNTKGIVGIVKRVAKDGSWLDVVWVELGHSKRMRATAIELVTPLIGTNT